jgi:glutathione S-transferase
VPTIVRKTADGKLQHAYESLVIDELVEELAPGCLLPQDAFERAQVRGLGAAGGAGEAGSFGRFGSWG